MAYVRQSESFSNTATGCGDECTKCHKLSNDEALTILKEGIPDVKIISLKASPVNGLWEIAFESRGQKGICYLDFSKQNVIFGNIFMIKTKTNLTGDRLAELNKIDVSLIPLKEALIVGKKDAPNKVIVFSDPD